MWPDGVQCWQWLVLGWVWVVLGGGSLVPRCSLALKYMCRVESGIDRTKKRACARALFAFACVRLHTSVEFNMVHL